MKRQMHKPQQKTNRRKNRCCAIGIGARSFPKSSKRLQKARRSVVSCGNRGLTLQFVEDPSNYVGNISCS